MQVEQYYSDDYAGLDAGNLRFYYGYEETSKNLEWNFVVLKNGTEVFRRGQSEIEKSVKDDQLDDVRDYLIAGIGMYLLLK